VGYSAYVWVGTLIIVGWDVCYVGFILVYYIGVSVCRFVYVYWSKWLLGVVLLLYWWVVVSLDVFYVVAIRGC